MLWLLGPLIIVVLVFAAGFRKTALGLLVGVVVAGGLIYWYNLELQEKATTRIAITEVTLENIAVRRTFDASYELTGRIKNNSKTYRIDGVNFTVRMRDCPGTESSNCVVTGETTTYVAVIVPPQEAGDFIGTLYYGRTHKQPKGRHAWDYEITEITAKRQ